MLRWRLSASRLIPEPTVIRKRRHSFSRFAILSSIALSIVVVTAVLLARVSSASAAQPPGPLSSSTPKPTHTPKATHTPKKETPTPTITPTPTPTSTPPATETPTPTSTPGSTVCGDTSGPGGSDLPCSCAQTVTTNTTLVHAVDPITTTTCSGKGLVLGPGVDLNVNGEMLAGSGLGNGVTIAADGTLRNGTLQGFGVGVDARSGTIAL